MKRRRRSFARASLALILALASTQSERVAHAQSAPPAPSNVRLLSAPPTAPSPSARALLTLSDLQWQGIAGRTPDGDSTDAGGSSAYAVGAFAVRYVNGERRLLIPNFKFGTNGETWGDLVEYREAGSRYSGSDPTEASALIETGRWPAGVWSGAYSQSVAWANSSTKASGAKLGTLYWDETRGLLWYQIYGYYTALNEPFLAAVQLLDTADSRREGYRAVGQSSVPFWYRSKDPGVASWKQVNYFLLPVPADAQADLGGSKYLLGGGTGAVVNVGNLGPGMTAIADLPAVTATNDVIDGRKIADYSSEAAASPSNARRNANYAAVDFSDHYITQFFPRGGWWLGSLDRVVGMTWIETSTKHGVLLYGVQGSGRISYGDNPLSTTAQELRLTHRGTIAVGTVSPSPLPFRVGATVRIEYSTVAAYNGTFIVTAMPTPTTFEYRLASDPGQDGGSAYVYGWDSAVVPDLVDPSRNNPEAQHGYLGENFLPQTWVFDPQHIREVGRGVRASTNAGINPIELGDWHAQWPNLPYDKQVSPAMRQSRWVADNVANRLFWDSRAQELLWVVPQSVSSSNPRLTVNVFTVR